MKTYSKLLFCDIETFSEADLKKCGVYRYAEDPTFEVQLFGFAYDDEPVQVVDIANGEEIPKDMLADLTDPDVLKIAHNANFERTCLSEWLETYMAPEQWYCTAVRASTLGLPRSLAGVGEAIGLPEDEKKMAVGKRLIQYFAKPCAPTKTNGGRRRNLPHHEPEKWALYKEYNAQDVATERAIYRRMSKFPEISDAEHELWCIDQRINEHGALVDTEFIENILDYSERRAQLLEDRAKAISGVDNPSSFPQIRKWLKTKGLDPKSLDKEAVKELIKQCTDEEVVEFLKIRQELGKTSVAKYTAMDQAKCEDGRVRGMFQYYGAATGRWTSRIVQLQNLPQNKMADLDLAHGIVKSGDFELLELLYNSPMDVFSQLIRTAFIAGKGKTYAVADYSAIEARVIAWLADEDWVLQAFREGKDIYCETASQMFKVPVVKNGINGELRAKGKVATLACGYQGSVGAMRKMGGEKMGLTDAEMKSIVEAWRIANPKITALWKAAENTMKKAIVHPGVAFQINHGITFQMQDKVLFITLPSGRAIAYQGARIERTADKTSIKYMRQEQTSQKWVEADTYGGSIVENITQAIARDCLGTAIVRLHKAGYTPSMHIHDEVVIEVDKKTAESDLQRIREIMSIEDVKWKAGLPLKAEGYLSEYYKKD